MTHFSLRTFGEFFPSNMPLAGNCWIFAGLPQLLHLPQVPQLPQHGHAGHDGHDGHAGHHGHHGHHGYHGHHGHDGHDGHNGPGINFSFPVYWVPRLNLTAKNHSWSTFSTAHLRSRVLLSVQMLDYRYLTVFENSYVCKETFVSICYLCGNFKIWFIALVKGKVVGTQGK